MRELPFQVGQMAETRSLAVGFRGAWFRCKIKRIREKNGELYYYMQYVDYPEQKLEWIKVYQKPRKNKYSKVMKLMVRPSYPTVFLESEKPNISTISEEIVIVDGTWMVGDLVDFCADGCYWSGRVAKVLEDGKFKIDLFPPPMGEGSSYETCYKDIRPSLDWGPKKGWQVPISKLLNGRKRRLCAELIKPEHSDKDAVVESKSHPPPPSIEPVKNAPKTDIRTETAEEDDTRSKETNDGLINEEPSKKKSRKDNKNTISLDSMFLHSIEDAILDLEELVNKVKWAKSLLEFEKPLSSSRHSFWKLRQHLP